MHGLAQRIAQPEHRQTIGLALEGGGALGLAHLGLLEWFEQHHIPIDYIAGSSMGGLVAGFYTSGMSAAEMQKTVDGLDWDQLVAGQTDDRNLSFRRKEDVRTFGNETILGLRHGLVIPTGLNSGQGLNLLLSRVALPYSQMKASMIYPRLTELLRPISLQPEPTSSIAGRSQKLCAQPCPSRPCSTPSSTASVNL